MQAHWRLSDSLADFLKVPTVSETLGKEIDLVGRGMAGLETRNET